MSKETGVNATRGDVLMKTVQREIRNLRTEHGDRMNMDDAWDLAEAINDLVKERIREFADGVMEGDK